MPAKAGDTRDMGSLPSLQKSPGEGNGNSLQYSYWRIPRTEETGRIQFKVTESDTTQATLHTQENEEVREVRTLQGCD